MHQAVSHGAARGDSPSVLLYGDCATNKVNPVRGQLEELPNFPEILEKIENSVENFVPRLQLPGNKCVHPEKPRLPVGTWSKKKKWEVP